jgi:hypothetical protein
MIRKMMRFFFVILCFSMPIHLVGMEGKKVINCLEFQGKRLEVSPTVIENSWILTAMSNGAEFSETAKMRVEEDNETIKNIFPLDWRFERAKGYIKSGEDIENAVKLLVAYITDFNNLETMTNEQLKNVLIIAKLLIFKNEEGLAFKPTKKDVFIDVSLKLLKRTRTKNDNTNALVAQLKWPELVVYSIKYGEKRREVAFDVIKNLPVLKSMMTWSGLAKSGNIQCTLAGDKIMVVFPVDIYLNGALKFMPGLDKEAEIWRVVCDFAKAIEAPAPLMISDLDAKTFIRFFVIADVFGAIGIDKEEFDIFSLLIKRLVKQIINLKSGLFHRTILDEFLAEKGLLADLVTLPMTVQSYILQELQPRFDHGMCIGSDYPVQTICELSNDKIVYGSDNDLIVQLDLNTSKEQATRSSRHFEQQNEVPICSIVEEKQNHFFVCSDDGVVSDLLLEYESGSSGAIVKSKWSTLFKSQKGLVSLIRLKSGLLAAGTKNGKILFFDVVSKKPLVLSGADETLVTVVPFGSRGVLGVSSRGNVLICDFDKKTCERVHEFTLKEYDNSWPPYLKILDDERFLVVFEDGAGWIFSVNYKKVKIEETLSFGSNVRFVEVLPDKRIAIGTKAAIKIFTLQRLKYPTIVANLEDDQFKISTAGVLSDGRLILGSINKQGLRIMSLDALTLEQFFFYSALCERGPRLDEVLTFHFDGNDSKDIWGYTAHIVLKSLTIPLDISKQYIKHQRTMKKRNDWYSTTIFEKKHYLDLMLLLPLNILKIIRQLKGEAVIQLLIEYAWDDLCEDLQDSLYISNMDNYPAIQGRFEKISRLLLLVKSDNKIIREFQERRTRAEKDIKMYWHIKGLN